MNNYNMTNLTIANIKQAIECAETSLYISEELGATLAKINPIALKTLVKVARAKLRNERIIEDNKNDKV